ncbi:MAG TPA: helix-turn-helix domain-containing protein [Gammaproteobacteria bacterium]|nr:helix-turn-helix domain-containing protein [Gammaproteobacteria bacterium]
MATPRTFGIGELARQSDVKVETVRYYEQSGLLPNPPRTEGGHRLYTEEHFKRLVFIRRCRELGFSMEEIHGLLALVDGGKYTCGEVQALTLEHAAGVRRKIKDLRRLERTLTRIASGCEGGAVPECPIIDALSDPGTRLTDAAR